MSTVSTSKLIFVTVYDAITDTASIHQEIIQRSRKVDLAKAFAGVGFSSNNAQIILQAPGDIRDVRNVLEPSDVISFLSQGSDMTTTGTLLTSKVLDSAVTAIGTNQAGAYQIIKPISVITVGANTTGVKLPALSKFLVFIVENLMPNTINVFPATGDFIDALAVNVAVAVPAFSRTIFYTKKNSIAATVNVGWNSLLN